MHTLVRFACTAIISAGISAGVFGCEYVRPTLNVPLAKWDPQYGSRFVNLAPPEEGNSDSLFIIASFSGGGTRASTLAFGVLRELLTSKLSGKASRNG